MRQTILDTFDRERVRTGLTAGIATVGRPTGVGGKKMSPRRAKMTSKEVDHIKTRAGIKAGGPGSGRHSEGQARASLKKYGWQEHSKTNNGGSIFRHENARMGKIGTDGKGNFTHKAHGMGVVEEGNHKSLGQHLKFLNEQKDNFNKILK